MLCDLSIEIGGNRINTFNRHKLITNHTIQIVFDKKIYSKILCYKSIILSFIRDIN